MKKKILAVFLSLCMAMSLLPVTALATGGEETETQTPTESSITTEEALKEAIEDAQPGDTVTLGGDIAITAPVVINKQITLDLNEKTIYAKKDIWNEVAGRWSLISVGENGDLTVTGNGTLQAKKDDTYAIDVNGGSCTIENGTFVGNVHAVYVLQGTLVVKGGTFSVQQTYSAAQPYEFVLNCYDTNYENGSAQITVYGGSFEGFNPRDCEAEGVGTNFCAPGYVVDVKKGQGTDLDTYTVKKLDEGSMAVFPAQSTVGSVSASLEGTFTSNTDKIQGGGTAGGPSGAVDGGNVSVDLTTKDSNPSTAASLNVATDTAQSLAANANSLTVESDVGNVTLNKAALGELADVTAPVVISIKATDTDQTNPTWEVTVTSGEGENNEIFDKGLDTEAITISVPYTAEGASSENTKVYCIDNGMEDMNAKLEGDNLTWTTSHLSTFAAVTLGANDTITYTTADGVDSTSDLAIALSSVKYGGTITLLKDIPNAKGIAVPSEKNFTIDFGGHTYTLSGPGAGSTNTETNGFQLLKDSTITFKNGTIRIAEGATLIKRIIQNYADLTLENMQIYAENQVDGENYPLSFNNGNIVFKGNTSIYTTENTTNAFDVCKYADYPSTIVTFDESYTGRINGNIVYDSDNADSHKLIINGNGTFGGIKLSSAVQNITPSITISGGSFKESVAQYVTSDLKYEANANGTYTYHGTLDAALAVSDTVSSVEAAKDDANAVTVTVKNGNDVDTIKLTSGTEYSLPDYPDQGYNHFQGWTDQAGNRYNGGQTVKIEKDTTFTAVWSYIPPANPNYRIDIPAAEGGTVTANPAAAKAGATVTLTATPDEGYAVGTITVTDRFGDAVKVTENADGTYTFTMPNGQVTVKATFVETEEPAPAEPFPDVDENDWFYDEVVYVYENGLMNGVENNQFAPNTATNRAMLATILYRLAGQPDVSGDLPFTDVEAGTWYTNAVLWAAQNGIVNGVTDTTFAPGNDLTREQLVTMLYRYAEAAGYDVSAAADLSGYPDAGKVQTYAQKAMSWAVAEGIVEGMDGNLNPAGSATRAQIATILMRFCEGVGK